MTSLVTTPTLALTALLALPQAAAAFINPPGTISYGSTNGNDANDCRFTTQLGGTGGPCLTLSRALAQTVAGGQIFILDPGYFNYAFPITVDRSLHIAGDGDAAMRIDGPTSTPA